MYFQSSFQASLSHLSILLYNIPDSSCIIRLDFFFVVIILLLFLFLGFLGARRLEIFENRCVPTEILGTLTVIVLNVRICACSKKQLDGFQVTLHSSLDL